METRTEKLKRKQSSTQAHWLRVWQEIQASPDTPRAMQLLDEAAERTLSRIPQNGVGWCWSGGKDSLALEAVLNHAGLLGTLPGMGALTQLEFPDFAQWCHDHAPRNVKIWTNYRINIDWLMQRPDYLFPAKNASRWFTPVQKAAQRTFARQNDLRMLIGGWRAQDGNYLGQGGRTYEYTTPEGIIKYSPIAQWAHEDLLHVIAHTGMELPPIYDYPRGFPVGTGPWPARPRLNSISESWHEIYGIDHRLVEQAHEAGMVSASKFLETM